MGYKENQKRRDRNCTWTPTALDCYRIGAVCDKCIFPPSIKKKCKMKDKIIQITREYGKPFDRTDSIITERKEEHRNKLLLV